MKFKLKLYAKNILCFILLLAVVVSAAAFSVTPKRRASAETIVTQTSPGGYDEFTTETNKKLGITGSVPDISKTGDANFSFALKPTVEIYDVETAHGTEAFTSFFEFVLNEQNNTYFGAYDNCFIWVNERYEEQLSSERNIMLRFQGEYSNENLFEDKYIDINDFTKTGSYYKAPLSKWLNVQTSERWYSDGRLEKCRMYSYNGLVFAISPDKPPELDEAYSFKTRLSYNLRLENSDLEHGKRGYNYSYFFDLVRTNASGTSEQLLTRYVVYNNRTELEGSNGEYVFAKKDFTYAKGILDICPKQYIDADSANKATSFSISMNDNDYTVLESKDFHTTQGDKIIISTQYSDAYLTFEEKNEIPTINFDIDTDDFDAEYRCRFGYIIEKKVTKTKNTFLWFTEEYDELELYKSGCIWSEAASIASILEGYDEAGTLDSQYSGPELSAANKIIDDINMQSVQLVMLEQIGKTPFAHKVVKNVTLPVRQGRIYYDTICKALDMPTLKVLNSNVESVVTLNSDGQYELIYLSAVWLHAASVSGAALDSFLSINESYEEFYNRQTGFNIERDKNGRIITGEANPSKAVLTIGTYEYFLNEIKNEYPELEKYKANEIYGYWGFFAIPHEYNLDAAWTEVFGTTNLYKNIAHYFKHDVSLSYEAYDALLNEYGHSYLARLFSGVVGGVFGYDATYYMVYVDDAGYAAATQNGTTDPDGDGLLQNKGQDVLGKVESIFSGAINWILDLANNNIGTIITIAIIIVAVIVVIKFILSNKKGKGKKK